MQTLRFCVFRRAALVAAVLMLTATTSTTVIAAENSTAITRLIEVTGSAQVRATPDRGRFSASVVTEAATAKKASQTNARVADAVVKALSAKVGGDGEVRSAGYSLRPNYEWAKKDGGQTRILRGYVASNEVSVTTSDLASIGALLDLAVTNGANEAGQIEFFLADDAEATRAATLEAGHRARLEAETVAESLGVQLGQLVHASTREVEAAPKVFASQMRMADGDRGGAQTPMQPGSLLVTAEVQVSFAIR
jgi:uncharacterized protein YggE